MSDTPPSDASSSKRRYGTFEGVFVPTLLTILGVIMYLREGWVIGNAGLLGGLLIIGIAFGISGATALSMSSVTTNIRIGAGGAYSIISRSLGLEVGGSIGIPLYLSQALAVTLYVSNYTVMVDRAAWGPAVLGGLLGVLVRARVDRGGAPHPPGARDPPDPPWGFVARSDDR